jgi:hypothetical protein
MSSEAPALNLPYQISPSVVNCKIDQRSIQNRPGYDTYDRDLGAGEKVYGIDIFQVAGGSRYTLYLTASDLIYKELGTSDTWSFKTEMGSYTATKQVDAIDAGTKLIVTFEGATTLQTDGVAADDYFVLDEDLTADREPDASWRKIASVDSETQLTLSTAYQKAVTTPGAKDAFVRKVYTMPSNERWSWAIVDDKFCFTNGNTNVQYWSGSNYAAALDSTYATKARYCIEYANRLVLADLHVSGARNPYRVKWSGEGDPTAFDVGADATGGAADMLRTDDYITGLGRVGQGLVVYKRDSLVFGNETGVSTAPIEFPIVREGIGCIAPYSIVHIRGTNVFLGRDDFYQIDRNDAFPIGGSNMSRMKHRFFDVVSDTEAYHIWGEANVNTNTVHWFANTSEGHRCFTWNYITGEWTEDEFYHEISCIGRGAL